MPFIEMAAQNIIVRFRYNQEQLKNALKDIQNDGQAGKIN